MEDAIYCGVNKVEFLRAAFGNHDDIIDVPIVCANPFQVHDRACACVGAHTNTMHSSHYLALIRVGHLLDRVSTLNTHTSSSNQILYAAICRP